MLHKAKSLNNSMIEVDELSFGQFVDVDSHEA